MTLALPRKWFVEARVVAGRWNENYKIREFEFQWLKLNNGTIIELFGLLYQVYIIVDSNTSFALLFAIDEIIASSLV